MSAEWIRQQLEKFGVSFDEADKDKSGFLSPDEIFDVLVKNGFKGSKGDAKKFFKQLDINDDQKITRDEFSVAVEKIPRVELKELALRRTFKQLDKDGSGTLSRKEIIDATRTQAGVDVEAEKVADLLLVLSKDTTNDTVDYVEFLVVFGLRNTGNILQQIFSGLDKDHSGFLTKEEIMAAIAGEPELKLRAAKISDLLIAWHKDQDRKIHYDEFVQVWMKYRT